MSNNMAALADSLSRETTITDSVKAAIQGIETTRPWGALGAWLKAPGLDWDLPLKLLSDVKNKLNTKDTC
jgi:hypothetical protein